MEEPKPKRRPGRPKKVVAPTPVVDDMPPLEPIPESPELAPVVETIENPEFVVPPPDIPLAPPPSPPEEPLRPLPEEPPIRYPNHLTAFELRSEITKYADIVGGRMRQLVLELNKRFPFQR